MREMQGNVMINRKREIYRTVQMVSGAAEINRNGIVGRLCRINFSICVGMTALGNQIAVYL